MPLLLKSILASSFKPVAITVTLTSSFKLSSITHPRKKLGLKAIEILMNMDNDNRNRNYLVNPEIIERGSVCKLKKN